MTDKQIRCSIFCKVIDNLGDAGVCWRLARQLAREFGWEVQLYIDEPHLLDRLVPDWQFGSKQCVQVTSWSKENLLSGELPDVLIEAFACDLPTQIIDSMWSRSQPPLWINLEYLTAEPWIDDCHLLPSPHPRGRLTKFFFFPGFSRASGGILHEADYAAQRERFSRAAFLQEFGIPESPDGVRVSLFCYPQAPVDALCAQLAASPCPIQLLIPGDGQHPNLRDDGNLQVISIPFLPQARFDELLWACDLNFVRGEDSFVRAQLAGKPLVWHIYPQEQTVHMTKLEAFLQRYLAHAPKVGADSTARFWQFWNGHGACCWPDLLAALPSMTGHARQWAEGLVRQDDLATQLVRFCRERLECSASQNPSH